ncbi:MAG: metal-dependent hydrolase [Bacteroidia bacterium]|nr:metal-dependent hydrolase [Bacteroidia bacterium]
MDSLTQIVLGAACGEAVLGRKAGNKALLWGAIGGTIPDLDVFLNPFFHPVDALFVHRGFSHSLLFAFLVAPVMGGLVGRLHRRLEISWRSWTMLFFLSVFTHPLLDALTGYGTSLFLPFHEYRVDVNCVFIIDPLYTLPFLFCLIMVMWSNREEKQREKWNRRGLILSTAYLIFTFIHQQWILRRAGEELKQQGIKYSETKAFTTPFNSLLYGVLARTDSGYYVGYRSMFDSDLPMEFCFHPSRAQLLDPWTRDPQVSKLIRFTKGWYQVDTIADTLLVSDLRFGQTSGWADPGAPFVFSMKVIPRPDGSVEIRKNDWRSDRMAGIATILNRIKGK